MKTVHPLQETEEEEGVDEIGRENVDEEGRVEDTREAADLKALQEEREPNRRHDHAREGGHRERQREEATDVGRDQERGGCADKKKLPGRE